MSVITYRVIKQSIQDAFSIFKTQLTQQNWFQSFKLVYFIK